MAEPRTPQTFTSTREKNLSFARENSAYNKAWFEDLQRRAAAGEPIAFVNADVPTEIFKAMDIPVVVNQWWSSVIAAKQKSAQYLGALNALGYRQNLCKYCALGFAATLEPNPEEAPWGGLPTPSIVVSGNECNALQKIFELWARKFDIPFVLLETATIEAPDSADWTSRARRDWESVFGARAIDLLTDQYRELIATLEKLTGRTFDAERLRRINDLVNEQEEYYFKARELISATRPAPVNIADQMPATMIPQWHRGTEWARDRARLFYEELERKAAAGEAAAPNEQVRLMWIGTGLWYNLDFYAHFQERYGAVFVWSIYLSIAADAYATYGDDPLRALAGRMTKIARIMHTPPFNVAWYVAEAKKAGVDAIVSLGEGEGGEGCREVFGYTHLLRKGFEDAGIPYLSLGVDNVDARSWDEDAIRARVGDFIEAEVLAKRR
ncbi:2-hydroxyacyl-CoA dehydratase subunit D [Phenylobacterium soli]|uniref:2-hydroxyacyl-CoA dehydratase n=1 Tax=Phenylobacterium soli TaxID=2170551 RepID=A0A328ABE6_9CAUL|nr:2-hydroxyacyl-CoA dehydratase family protein [Phenylobacterium soli]RAK51777.1 2-hydroxyacyl-CoA dehydratase [Phenylobacterium soli]